MTESFVTITIDQTLSLILHPCGAMIFRFFPQNSYDLPYQHIVLHIRKSILTRARKIRKKVLLHLTFLTLMFSVVYNCFISI